MQNKWFGSKSFYRSAFMIALPVMGQNLIQNLVSLIDSFMVSGLGDVKMSGVNIAGQILFVLMVALETICASGGIFLTQFFGAGNKRGMQQSVCFKIIAAGCTSLVYLLVCMVFPRPILSLMVRGNSQAGAILDVGVRYMFLMGLIGIPMAVSNIIATSLREIGSVRVPLVISVTATLVNTFLNWVLIYGHLGAPRLEVEGAAYATITARVLEMLLYLFYIRRNKQPFAVGLSDLARIDWRLFREILSRGSLIILSDMVWVISETVTTALYNSRGGADVVSGMASSFAIANLYFVAFNGIATATAIIIGKSLGAGRLDEARAEQRWMLSAAAVFGVFMTLVGLGTMLLVPVVFGGLSPASQEICGSMVFWMAVFMPFWVFQNAQYAISRAGGDTLMGIVVDVTVTVCIATPAMFCMTLCTDIPPVTMYILIKCADFLKITLAAVWLKKERWVRNLAEGHAQ